MKGALVLAVLTVSALAAPALADEASDLFDEGRKLAGKGDYVAACDRFERALKIDPTALGTELNLADCFEHRAQTARAWHMFDSISARAKVADEATRAKFEKYARDRADKLTVQLVTVRLHVKAPIPDGLAISINNNAAVVAPEIKDYADPGTIVVEASAPSAPKFREERRGGAGAAVDVDISFRLPQKQIEPPAVTGHLTRKKSYRTAAFALAGGGGVSLLASGIFTLVARSKHDGVLDDGSCHKESGQLVCTPDGASRETSAGHFADLATVTALLGVALVASGGVVFEIAPKVSAHDAGVVVTARF